MNDQKNNNKYRGIVIVNINLDHASVEPYPQISLSVSPRSPGHTKV